MVEWVRPAALSRGDRVAVVAPSGPVPRDAFLAGLAWLRERYDVSWSPRQLDRQGYLAGGDDARRDELVRAWADPRNKAIFAARGGYGAMRFLDLGVDFGRPRAGAAAPAPWLVGFSDVTALHLHAQRARVCSLHAANVTGLAHAHAGDRHRLLAWLEGAPVAAWTGLERLGDGPDRVRGVALGGNLALVHAMAAASALPPLDDAILFLEDITEKPYRVDRMLTSLRLAGVFEHVRGVVFGGFEQCDAAPDGVTVRDVVVDRLGALGVPILWGAPFGHGARNEAIAFGATVHIDGDAVAFD